jgi:N-acetyl-anhydromuramyl-L-alanine amidase AmpD
MELKKESVRFIAVHCSATPPDMDIGVEDIRKWHKEQGWDDVGYHYVIQRDGLLEAGRPLDVQGAHVAGHNHESVGICLVGGVNKRKEPDANFTAAQYASLESIIALILPRFPGAVVRGHRDFPGVTKACPSFDAIAWWSHRNVAE